MLTSERLAELARDARHAGSAGDAAVAQRMLAELTGADDAAFAALDLQDLKNAIQTAVLLGGVGDGGAIASVLARCVNAMQALGDPPGACEFILPLYNLRATYLQIGETDRGNQLLGYIVEMARQSGVVTSETTRALAELLPAFENAGYTDAAVAIYRPICETVLASPQIDANTKLAAIARLGRLQLANGKPDEAVSTYERALASCDDMSAGPSAEADSSGAVASFRMTLWRLIAEARSRADDVQGAERAFEAARSLAADSADPDSLEAGVLYHNQAGFWLQRGMRDRYQEGIELTRRSLAISERLGKRQAMDYAAGLGQIANFEAALGHVEEAERNYASCFETFAAAPDTDSANVAAFREDEGRFFLESGRACRAVDSFVAARETLDSIKDSSRVQRADTNAWIGVALFEDGDYAQAIDAFRRAIRLRMDEPASNAASGKAS